MAVVIRVSSGDSVDWLDATLASLGLLMQMDFTGTQDPSLSPCGLSSLASPWNDSLRILFQDGRGQASALFEAQALEFT